MKSGSRIAAEAACCFSVRHARCFQSHLLFEEHDEFELHLTFV